MRDTHFASFQFAPGDPGNISTVAELVRYVQELEGRLQAALAALAAGGEERQYKAPARPRDGTRFYGEGALIGMPAGLGLFVYDGIGNIYKKLG